MRLTLLALFTLVACNGPSPHECFEGVEGTGYLDNARVSVTTDGPLGVADPVAAWVIGRSGAATDIDEITVVNLTSTQSASGTVTADGAFAIGIELSVDDGLSVGDGEVEVPLELPPAVVHSGPVPSAVQTTRQGSDVLVEADFDTDPPFHYALSNPTQVVTVEMTAETLRHHVGTVTAEPGEALLIYGFLLDSPDGTVATEVIAP